MFWGVARCFTWFLWCSRLFNAGVFSVFPNFFSSQLDEKCSQLKDSVVIRNDFANNYYFFCVEESMTIQTTPMRMIISINIECLPEQT